MKKNGFKLFFTTVAVAGVLAFGLMSFREVKGISQASLAHADLLSDDVTLPPGYFTSISADFGSANFSANILPTTVEFTQLNLNYIPSATPPWYTYQYIGVLQANMRPSGTRTFTGYNIGNPSQTVSFTLYSNGELYMQQTGGVTMPKNIGIASAIYTL